MLASVVSHAMSTLSSYGNVKDGIAVRMGGLAARGTRIPHVRSTVSQKDVTKASSCGRGKGYTLEEKTGDGE